MANTPNIRFAGFTDAWEQRKLGNVVDVCSGKDYKHLDEGEIPVYGTGGYMLSVSEALSQHDAIGIGRKGTIDNPYILRAPFWTVDTLFYCVPKNCDLNFVYALYQTINWRTMDESTGVPSLSKTAINDVDIHIPSVDEQHRIGELFSNLDETITLHQCKCFQDYSVSFTGKITFDPACFTATWEQRKLGNEAVEILAGGDIDKEKAVVKGKYPIYANALTKDGIVGYYNDYYRVKAPAVTVTGRGEVGHAQARMTDFTPVVRLLAIRANHDCYYLENAINNHKVIVESTGVPQLTVPQLSSYEIYFPKDLEEEIRIGELFHNLDNIITLHQRKLEKLKNIKKSMLESMFV